MKIFFYALFIILITSTAYSTNKGSFSRDFSNNGITSRIDFYVPNNYDSTKSYSILFGFHGTGMASSTARDILYNFVNTKQINAIVVCPDYNNIQTNAQFWNLINTSMAYPASIYHVDSTKRIIIGMSAGSSLAFQLGLLSPSSFKGILGISPALTSNIINQTMWANISKIKMASILGTSDENYTPVKELMNEIKDKGGKLLYIEKTGVGHLDNKYINSNEFYDDFLECYNYFMEATSIETENASNSQSMISLFPNPVTDAVRISFQNINSTIVQITISNTFGEVIKRFNYTELDGKSTIDINTKDFTSGVYYCTVNTDINRITKSFIVIR